MSELALRTKPRLGASSFCGTQYPKCGLFSQCGFGELLSLACPRHAAEPRLSGY